MTGQRPYQDVWRRGRLVQRGKRECGDRYSLIAGHIRQLGLRNFRALDLGAYGGYFSVRRAEDFGANVVAVDDWAGLAHSLRGARGVTAVNRRLSPEDVAKLGTFDVTLALSVLHHVERWQDMLDTLKKVTTSTLYVEYTNPDEALPRAVAHTDELFETCSKLGGEVLGYAPGYNSTLLRPLRAVKV